MTACCESVYNLKEPNLFLSAAGHCNENAERNVKEKESHLTKNGTLGIFVVVFYSSDCDMKARIYATGACMIEQQRAVRGSWEVELMPEWPEAERAVLTPNILILGATSPAVLLQSEGEMHLQSVMPAVAKARDGIPPAAHCTLLPLAQQCVCGAWESWNSQGVSDRSRVSKGCAHK